MWRTMTPRDCASFYEQLTQIEVNWYLEHGKFRDRIVRDKSGNKYVIGDWSWNAKHPDRYECIERRMSMERNLGK